MPWSEEPGGLLSMGSHRVGHDWSDLAAAAAVTRSCLTLQPYRLEPTRLLCPWNSPGKNTGVGDRSLLQIFLTQGSNPGLPHCRQILYHLNHQGNSNECFFPLLKHRFRIMNFYRFYIVKLEFIQPVRFKKVPEIIKPVIFCNNI